MARPTNIIIQPQSSYALHRQQKVGQYGIHLLKPNEWMFFGCKYCYSPWVVYGWKPDRKKRFFETVHVKMDKAQHLAKELLVCDLPRHMKRVQINETSEYYLPQLLNISVIRISRI